MKLSTIKIILSISVIVLCFSSCFRWTNEKYAFLIQEQNLLQLRDDAIIMSPLTPEGPFPEDIHVLHIVIDGPIENYYGKKLIPGKDITVRYNYVEGGYIIINKDTVEVRLKYSSEYWENHNGILKLKRF